MKDINDTLCGIGHFTQVAQETIYTIHVLSDQSVGGLPGCGAPGSTIMLQLNGQELSTLLTWDNQRLHQQDISQAPSATPTPTPNNSMHIEYLPLIKK